jgi:hypothetical protein
MSEPKGTDLAPDDQVWVCSACGKTSRSKYGFDAMNRQCADRGWDESCMLNSVLCYAEKGPDGKWQAVRP